MKWKLDTHTKAVLNALFNHAVPLSLFSLLYDTNQQITSVYVCADLYLKAQAAAQ